jgi:hypothetical protein
VTVKDLPRVMRLPGFIHRKAEPFLSRVVQIADDLPLYGLGELSEAFPLPEGEPATAQRQKSKRKGGGKWGALNERALKPENLAKWVPAIFPSAKKTRAGGFRVASADLGRGFQEDLSIDPRGIKYFGVADQGDKRKGRRTAVEVIAEFQQVEQPQAAAWLEKALAVAELPEPPPEPPPQEQSASEVEIEITRLAKLSLAEYDQQRGAVGEKLGVRLSTLDTLVARERQRLGLAEEIKKAADILIELSARAKELFHAPDETAFATIPCR